MIKLILFDTASLDNNLIHNFFFNVNAVSDYYDVLLINYCSIATFLLFVFHLLFFIYCFSFFSIYSIHLFILYFL